MLWAAVPRSEAHRSVADNRAPWRALEGARFCGRRRGEGGVQVALPYAVQVASVLGAGRTIGEWTISVRAVPRRSSLNRWEPLAPIVKLLTGITPPVAFLLLGGWWALLGIPVFLTLTVLAAPVTRQRRGLSHSLAWLDLRIAWDEHLRRDGEPIVAEPVTGPRQKNGDR